MSSKRRKTEAVNHAFLIPQFAGAASAHVELEGGVEVTLGRNDGVLGIVDKNVSRTQATVQAALDSAHVVVAANGMNPILVLLKSGTTKELTRGQRVELKDGDRFSLLPDKYAIKIEIERELPDAAEDSATQPLDDDDDDNDGVRTTTRELTVDHDRTIVADQSHLLLDEFNYEDAFQFVSREPYRRALLRQPWRADAWLRWFELHSARDSYNEAAVRAMRILVLEGTIECVRRGSYSVRGSAQPVAVDRARMRAGVLRSELHPSFAFAELLKQQRFAEPAKIVVKEVDCIEAALHLKIDKQCSVAVLNMANATRPGGGYKTGAGAQEENLHRRSNLHQHLEDPDGEFGERAWSYPIPEFGAVYSPDVAFFRTSEDTGYDFMPQVEYLSVVSVAADFKPKLVEREMPLVTADSDPTFGVQIELRLTPEFETRMKKRIEHMLGLCVARGHDAVVLSAFGCGAFRNPPRHVAQLFRDTIKEKKFHFQFKFIMFAIIDDHNARQPHNPKGNFEPFFEVFYKRLPDRGNQSPK